MLAGALCLADLPTVPATAHAQDDWGLTRQRGGRDRARPRRPSRPARGQGRRRPRGERAQPQGPQREAPERADVLIQRYRRIVEQDPRETFAFRRLLDLYRERDGNIDRLVEDLRAQIAADGEAYAPRMMIGHIFKAQNHADEARAAYERASELRPREAAPRIALAQIERAAGASAAARQRYEEALERTRERLAREELLREVAQLALEMDDFEAARGFYEELARGGDGSVYLRAEYARALSAAREWDRAVKEYERVIRSLRGDNRVLPPVLLELSRAQLERADPEASIETLDRALRLAGRQAGIRAEIYDQLLLAHRRTDRLPALAERLRGEAGRGFESNELLGRIEDELGNDAEALEAYRRALRSRPRDIDTRVRIIQLLSRSGRLDDVIDEYRALIRQAPREPRFVIELAQLLMQTDHREDALRLLRDTGRRHARDPILHQQLAELYARWGEEALAASEIELLARIDPRDPVHVIALGASQFDRGEREAALATWRRVLEVERGAEGHATLAQIYGDHDLLPLAIEQWREAVRLEPEEVGHVRGLATALERNRQNDAAEAQWQRVLELAGDDRVARREARERIVGIWSRTRQLPTQIRELERRFASEPPDAEAGRFLAEAHRRRGPQHQAQAERVLERVAEIAPGDVESLLALERIRRHRGDLAGAIDVLRQLRDADPRRAAHYLQQMAEHALALYRDEEAVRYAAEAVERNPDDASGHRRLADLYRARQDMPRAIASYQRALELNERLYPVYFELAELYLARGESARADRLYRQVLRITPDDDLVSRAARASIQINLGAGTLVELERDLLPLALGHPQRPIFRRMVVELYDAYAGPLVLRARRGGEGASEAREELRQIGTRGIKPLLEALADADPSQRRVALDILGDLGNPNAAAPLLAVAENPALDLGSRLQALRAAGAVADASEVGRLVALAEGDDHRLSGLAAWSLARLGGREAERALRRLQRSDDTQVVGYAAIGLGLHSAAGSGRGGDTAAELERAVRSATDEDILHASIWALGRAGDARHAPALAEVLRTRGGATSRIAAEALGRSGGDEARDALIGALFDPDAQLRRAAARALRARSDDGADGGADDEEEAELPAPHAFERVRDYVLRVVRAEDAALPPVEDLSAWAPALEEAASLALRGAVERALPALVVRGARAHGLSLGPLTADLDAWPDVPRSAAERALDQLGDGLVDELVEAAAHLAAAVRVAAVRLLARLDHPDAVSAVAASLSSPPASVQRAALDALSEATRTPSGAVVARLSEIVREHRDWSMRTRAAAALGRSRDEAARAALRGALTEDPYAFVRQAAAAALGVEASAQDLEALEWALARDEEPRVRASAAASLIASGGEAAQRARAQTRRDASPRVRAVTEPESGIR